MSAWNGLKRAALWSARLAFALPLAAMPPRPSAASLLDRIAAALDQSPGPRVPGSAAGALSRAEALALTRALSGSPVYAEAAGRLLTIEAVGAGARQAVELGDGFGARLDLALRALPPDGRQAVAMTRETARALGPGLDALAARTELRIVARGLPPMPLRRIETPGGGPRHFVELRPGLVAPLDADIPEAAARVLEEPVRRDAIRVLPVFASTDVDSLAALAAAAGDRLMDARGALAGAGGLRTAAVRDRLVVAVGHVEGDAFVARHASGAVEGRIPFAELERAAGEGRATLLLSVGCGCYATGAGSGYMRPVTDLEVAASLRAAFEARTNSDLLAAFGRPGNPYVIDHQALERLLADQALRLQRMSNHAALADGASAGLRVFGRKPETTGPAVLQGVTTAYGVGCLGLLSFRRYSRARFLALFPLLPNPVFRPLAQRLGWLLREALFWLLAPFVGFLVLLAIILLNGWKERDELHQWGWSLFLRPVEFLFETTLMAAFWLLSLAVLVVPAGGIVGLSFVAAPDAGPMSLVRWVFYLAAAGAVLMVWRARPKLQERAESAVERAVRRWPRAGRAVGACALPALLGGWAVSRYL